LIGGGIGLHWEDVDEDISVESLLSTKPLLVSAVYPGVQRARPCASLRAPPPTRQPLGGPKHYLISRSPGQHVSQAGRGEQRAEVSREDRLPTR